MYCASADSVHTVIAGGRVVVENGRPTFVDDLEGLIAEVEHVGRRIRAATGIDFPSKWPIV